MISRQRDVVYIGAVKVHSTFECGNIGIVFLAVRVFHHTHILGVGGQEFLYEIDERGAGWRVFQTHTESPSVILRVERLLREALGQIGKRFHNITTAEFNEL